jgi:hypothetical protein
VEIDKLIKGANVARFIKAQRIKWLGHIQRMDQARPTRKLLDSKPMGTKTNMKTKTAMARGCHESPKSVES